MVLRKSSRAIQEKQQSRIYFYFYFKNLLGFIILVINLFLFGTWQKQREKRQRECTPKAWPYIDIGKIDCIVLCVPDSTYTQKRNNKRETTPNTGKLDQHNTTFLTCLFCWFNSLKKFCIEARIWNNMVYTYPNSHKKTP